MNENIVNYLELDIIFMKSCIIFHLPPSPSTSPPHRGNPADNSSNEETEVQRMNARQPGGAPGKDVVPATAAGTCSGEKRSVLLVDYGERRT